MKQDIIYFVMSSLHNVQDWEVKSAKEFCKLILDGENIDYQEDDFNNITVSNTETRTIKIVKRYAEMYFDIYKNYDFEKAKNMKEIVSTCDKMLYDLEDLHTIEFEDEKQENPPFTIHFDDSVSKRNQEEIMKQVLNIYKEAISKIKEKTLKK